MNPVNIFNIGGEQDEFRRLKETSLQAKNGFRLNVVLFFGKERMRKFSRFHTQTH